MHDRDPTALLIGGPMRSDGVPLASERRQGRLRRGWENHSAPNIPELPGRALASVALRGLGVGSRGIRGKGNRTGRDGTSWAPG
ncbi:MAG: hypothetical protein E5V86_01090 [Mesorhizobium sp.]|nr:MAG: hypothetical protein E5V86_01090 [Mesorhizobium sp.]